MRTKALFPDMEIELATDKLAARRETRQRSREYLRSKHGFERFILNHLKANGPTVDANLLLAMLELHDRGENLHESMTVLMVAIAMWMNGILWRKEFLNHPSGERCYVYGIKGTHPKE